MHALRESMDFARSFSEAMPLVPHSVLEQSQTEKFSGRVDSKTLSKEQLKK